MWKGGSGRQAICFRLAGISSPSGELSQEALKLCQEVTVNQKITCQLCSSKCGRVEHSEKWPRIPRRIYREKWEQSDAIIQHVGLRLIETTIMRDIPRRIYRCLRERGNPTRGIIQMTCGNASELANAIILFTHRRHGCAR